MTTPTRIQRKRTKGWRMPAGTVYVGRPTMWGNPFKANGDTMEAIARYESALLGQIGWAVQYLQRYLNRFDASAATAYDHHIDAAPDIDDLRRLIVYHLKDRDLACWCRLCDEHKDGLPLGVKCDKCAPCHADVLLDLANR